jgi:hypothetical protein
MKFHYLVYFVSNYYMKVITIKFIFGCVPFQHLVKCVIIIVYTFSCSGMKIVWTVDESQRLKFVNKFVFSCDLLTEI